MPCRGEKLLIETGGGGSGGFEPDLLHPGELTTPKIKSRKYKGDAITEARIFFMRFEINGAKIKFASR